MEMVSFSSKFPEIAKTETRALTILNDSHGIKQGEYGFVELFCNDSKCDCRRAMIKVIGPNGECVATLNYGWESLSFYTDWMYGDKEMAKQLVGIQHYSLSPQSKDSNKILELFKNMMKDSSYANRIKHHYELFKNVKSPTKTNRIGKESLSVDNNNMISHRDKKASEVFLSYAAPVLEGDIEKLTIKELEMAISLPLAVWNAMAMQEWKGAKRNYLEDLYGPSKNEASYTDTKELIDVFIKRKKKFYKNAFWAFEIKVVKQSDGQYLFDASLKVPEELKGRVPKDWMRNEKVSVLGSIQNKTQIQ